MNDENSINSLFEENLLKMGKDCPSGTKEVFATLVRETLKFRDAMIERGEKPITVSEVEMALVVFQKTIDTGEFPSNIPQKVIPLLENWVAALTKK